VHLVLDTNVVLDLVVFHDPGVEAMRKAIEDKAITLASSRACLEEHRRVLTYPRFSLSAAEQEAALGWISERIDVIEGQPDVARLLPRCRDPDDQKFLEAAWAAEADFLVTKDTALLDLGKRVAKLGRFLVSLPTELPQAGR
jgi:uncharacterized protein